MPTARLGLTSILKNLIPFLSWQLNSLEIWDTYDDDDDDDEDDHSIIEEEQHFRYCHILCIFLLSW